MEPTGPPPPYQEAQASSSTSKSQFLEVPPKTRNGIPPSARRSMEDESRPLPPNWVRQFDAKSQHQFFVDTSTSPPRSIWHHPYDDDTYLASLTEAERDKLNSLHKVPTHADIEAESSGDDDHVPHHVQKEEPPKGVHKLGRSLKDKITNSTHQEREEKRKKRAQEEQEAYRRYLYVRSQMAKAAETGTPQLIGKDSNGRDVYAEPPGYGGGYNGYGGGYGYQPYGYRPGGVGGPYADPNARFISPPQPYGRPYGGGYGGGFGTGLGLPLLGLGGGLLLGELLF